MWFAHEHPMAIIVRFRTNRQSSWSIVVLTATLNLFHPIVLECWREKGSIKKSLIFSKEFLTFLNILRSILAFHKLQSLLIGEDYVSSLAVLSGFGLLELSERDKNALFIHRSFAVTTSAEATFRNRICCLQIFAVPSRWKHGFRFFPAMRFLHVPAHMEKV